MGKLAGALAQVNSGSNRPGDYGAAVNWKKGKTKLKNAVAKDAATSGWTVAKFDIGHFDANGFLTKSDKIVYISLDEAGKVLLRTASSLTDYTGGANQFTNVEGFESYMGRF